MLSKSIKTDAGKIPRHVAIIMDGNGRWANKRNLPKIAGHKKGAESVKQTIESCQENGVEYLTLYAFSSENWQRPVDEVEGLMELLRFYLGKELNKIHTNGVCLKIIGDRSKLSDSINKQIMGAEKLTKNNTKLTLIIALSYGSRQEIIEAVKSICAAKLKPEQIKEETFEKYLYTFGIPQPDLLIRTSGEQRLSNFLLWQLAYTELFFTDILWPDFKKENFVEAIEEFATRERRYGTS